MPNQTNVITSKQLIFIICGTVIGVSLLTITDTVGRSARQDTWIAVSLGFLLPLLGLLMINLVCRRLPDLTLAELTERLLGKWLGKVVSMVFILYGLVYSGLVSRIFINILKIHLFPNTPIFILLLIMLSLAAYLAAKDIRVLARVHEILFYQSQVLFLPVILALPHVDLTFFLPVGQAGLVNILKGTSHSLFSYLGMEILLVVYPMVKNKREIIKAGFIALGLVAFIYLSIVLTILGVFGPAFIARTRFSLLILLTTYETPVIERAEFFFILFYVYVVIKPTATAYFASRYTLEKTLGINSPLLVSAVLLPLVLVIALLPRDFEQAVWLSSLLAYPGIAFVILIPLILWLISLIRGIKQVPDRT